MTEQIVLLAGFEPFEKEPVNASWEAARLLDGQMVGGARIVARQLSCVFDKSREELGAALDTLRPCLVVAAGVAGGRTELSVERVAINVDDARIPDNAGAQPVDRPIVADGPAAYFSTLPIKRVVHAMRAAGVPAAVSQTAGTFVCNHIFYALMHALAGRDDAPRAGFIHVPYLPSQTAARPGVASVSVEIIATGLRVAIAEALRPGPDLVETGGALH
ncbi:pyroglutamyl-peptidase I [Chitinasiproducens palmae]|uniref:Pyrrolidone-carboxylate peptidase n=1 Tax=Chitinasiproducens palmae TaxID=1770053 RepID=A0A1H2PKW8_9BURK|nr:pyroglutamyl-peptidase I [Chitinasiproducens palmae]SDV46237.1 pyroglutamyl-peptidase I Cysteine peptidase. MEROPS family C15 [Chitinasiproducens palmae]